MNTVKTIGDVTHGVTSDFQGAIFLNSAYLAYEILDKLLNEGWFPADSVCGWTDIAVNKEKYYAVYGEDSVMVQGARLIYTEIEPTADMIKRFESFQQH
jgi:hypothetical protein